MILTRLTLCLLITFFPVISHAFGSITGTYVSDNRQREIIFLALTQSGNMLSGSLTITTADSNGGTKAAVQDLVGSFDGSSIDLKSDVMHLNGNQKGNAIFLSVSSTSGYRITYNFVAMNEDGYNKMLTDWRQSLAVTHTHDVNVAASKEYEENWITGLSKKLTTDISNIKNTGISADLSDIENAIGDQRIALQQMKTDMGALKEDAAVTPMTCNQAYQTIERDYSQTLGYDFHQTLGYSVAMYANASERLSNRLVNVPLVVDETTKDATTLQNALRISRIQLPASDVHPKDAKEQIVAYQKLASNAQARLPVLRIESNQVIEEAKALLAEGENIVHKAQSSVACK